MSPLDISQKPSLAEMKRVVKELTKRVNSISQITVNPVSVNTLPRFVISSEQSKLDFPIILE